MRDLTEAELIDMQRRVVRLLNAFEDDPDEISRTEIEDAFDIARDLIAAVSRDTERLCNHVRSQCAPSR